MLLSNCQPAKGSLKKAKWHQKTARQQQLQETEGQVLEGCKCILECLTFVLGCELLHFWGQGLIEALLPGDEGLADSVVIVAHHAAVPAHLVNERLQQDPPVSGSSGILAILAHFHGLTNTHCVGHLLHSWSMGRATWAGRGSSAEVRQPQGENPGNLLPCSDLKTQKRLLLVKEHLHSPLVHLEKFMVFIYIHILFCFLFASCLFQHAPHHLFNSTGKHTNLEAVLSRSPPIGLTADKERRRYGYFEPPMFRKYYFLPCSFY